MTRILQVNNHRWPGLFLIVALFAATIPVPHSAHAANTTYYVSPNGNDANNGTSSSQPWRTLIRVNKATFGPGDQILLAGGASFSGTLTFDAADRGTAAAPITVASYGTGRATISAGSGKGISIYNTAGFVIKDLIVAGGWNATRQSGNDGTGIEVYIDQPGGVKLQFIRIDDVEARGFKFGGIVVGAYPADGSKSGFEDVRITNSVVHDNGDVGIMSYGYFGSGSGWAHKTIYVGHCMVYNNQGLVDKGNNSGSGIVLSDVDGAVIERSVAHTNGALNNHPGGGPYGIWTWDSNNVTIQHNEAYRNKTGTADGGGFDLDGGVTNSVMQGNYSHDNQGPGYGVFQFTGARPFHNNVVRYNISQNDGGGFSLWDGNGDMGAVDLYNNTIWGAQPSVRTISPFTNVRFINNIFATTSTTPLLDIASAQGLHFLNNEYWSNGQPFAIKWAGTTYTSLGAWQQATAQEQRNGVSVGRNVDPRLTAPGTGPTYNDANKLYQLNAYKLQPNSPLIDHGLNLSTLGIDSGEQDFYGAPVPQGAGYDIGAHEVTQTATSILLPIIRK